MDNEGVGGACGGRLRATVVGCTGGDLGRLMVSEEGGGACLGNLYAVVACIRGAIGKERNGGALRGVQDSITRCGTDEGRAFSFSLLDTCL